MADRHVLAWASSQSKQLMFLSAITILELEYGALLLERGDPPKGAILRRWLDSEVLPQFEDRILPVDTAVARRCALLQVPNRRPDRDAFIAATALTLGMTVVTRNVRDFRQISVSVLDPWLGSPLA